jgi:argonaute-like protein implicated in RNA metabolism and viral defense
MPDLESKICRRGTVRGNKVPLDHGGVGTTLFRGYQTARKLQPCRSSINTEEKIKDPGHNGHID